MDPLVVPTHNINWSPVAMLFTCSVCVLQFETWWWGDMTFQTFGNWNDFCLAVFRRTLMSRYLLALRCMSSYTWVVGSRRHIRPKYRSLHQYVQYPLLLMVCFKATQPRLLMFLQTSTAIAGALFGNWNLKPAAYKDMQCSVVSVHCKMRDLLSWFTPFYLSLESCRQKTNLSQYPHFHVYWRVKY